MVTKFKFPNENPVYDSTGILIKMLLGIMYWEFNHGLYGDLETPKEVGFAAPLGLVGLVEDSVRNYVRQGHRPRVDMIQ